MDSSLIPKCHVGNFSAIIVFLASEKHHSQKKDEKFHQLARSDQLTSGLNYIFFEKCHGRKKPSEVLLMFSSLKTFDIIITKYESVYILAAYYLKISFVLTGTQTRSYPYNCFLSHFSVS